MASIFEYRKITDDFTTWQLHEPDYGDDDERITELGTVAGTTYVAVPAGMALPDQPKEITVTPVEMTDALRKQIADNSPHEALINKRTVMAIREEYSVADEIAMLWKAISNPTDPEVMKWREKVDDSVSEGRAKKEKFGLRTKLQLRK